MAASSAPAPRARLSQETLVDGLLALARESPEADISFRTLGAALGVNATAVYRHFRDKDELYRAAVDRLYSEALARVDRAGLPWRERLTQFADLIAEMFLDAPAIGQLAPLIDGRGAGELASIEFVLEAFEEAGLDGPDLIDAYSAYAGHTLALAAGMARETSRSERAQAATTQPWIKSLDAGTLAAFPRIAARQADLLALDTLGVYRAGVQAILGSIPEGASVGR